MAKAQEWLDKNYPKKTRAEETVLFINNNNLEGVLDLRDFTNLQILNCGGNQLTDIIFSQEPPKLEEMLIFPNSFTNPHKQLWQWWRNCKDISFIYRDDKFGYLFPLIEKHIDTSVFDNWVKNYDFSQQGNQEYHKIMGKKFLGWDKIDESYEKYPTSIFDELALKKMADQIVADYYIFLNRLVNGIEEKWEREMKRLATNFVSQTLEESFANHLTKEQKNALPSLVEQQIQKLEAQVKVPQK